MVRTPVLELADIPAQTTLEDQAISVSFLLTSVDSDTVISCNSNSLTYHSGNTNVVAAANAVTFSGAAPLCTATIEPKPNGFGTTNIAFLATDGALFVSSVFALNVTDVNDAPLVSTLANKTSPEDAAVLFSFTVFDPDSVLSCDSSSLSYASSNVALVAATGAVAFAGEAPNCTASVQPVDHAFGSGNITIIATDGSLTGASRLRR